MVPLKYITLDGQQVKKNKIHVFNSEWSIDSYM
jgi:hypothetical protein